MMTILKVLIDLKRAIEYYNYMYKIIRITTYLLFCLFGQVKSPNDQNNNVDKHLNFYATQSANHHDNIDDSTDVHNHRHKHSDDSKEHDHQHDHNQMTQDIVKINQYQIFKLKAHAKIEHKKILSEANLFLSAYSLDIYRPPIV